MVPQYGAGVNAPTWGYSFLQSDSLNMILMVNRIDPSAFLAILLDFFRSHVRLTSTMASFMAFPKTIMSRRFTSYMPRSLYVHVCREGRGAEEVNKGGG